jgi:thioredoxin reductase (NADPH)
MIYDVAIIGAGPAGLSAALTLQLHGKSLLWFGTPNLSTKVQKSEKIANYPGIGPIGGEELNALFRRQMDEQGLVLTDRMVTMITKTKRGFMLLGDNDLYDAKTVLLAIGSVSSKGLPNEEALLGRGVSYCATCDGFLYAGKTIAVYCGDARFEHEVNYLADTAAQVYLQCAPGCGSTVDRPNIQRLSCPIKEVYGEDRVSGIRLTDGTSIAVDGAFFLRSSVAPTNLLKGLAMDGPHIQVNRQAETNIPGCYAAGDCTGRPYQIAVSVGEGNVAAHSIVAYLAELERAQKTSAEAK